MLGKVGTPGWPQMMNALGKQHACPVTALLVSVSITASAVLGPLATAETTKDGNHTDPPPEASVSPASASTNLGLTPGLSAEAPSFTAGTSEVLKLKKAGISTPVIEAFIANYTYEYRLGAKEIIHLNQEGVPPQVVAAMIRRDGELLAQNAKPSKAEAAPTPPQPASTAVAATYPQATAYPGYTPYPAQTPNVVYVPSSSYYYYNYPYRSWWWYYPTTFWYTASWRHPYYYHRGGLYPQRPTHPVHPSYRPPTAQPGVSHARLVGPRTTFRSAGGIPPTRGPSGRGR